MKAFELDLYEPLDPTEKTSQVDYIKELSMHACSDMQYLIKVNKKTGI